MIKWRKNKISNERVGIELRDDGVAVAHRRSVDDRSVLNAVAFLPADINASKQKLLSDYVRAQGLQRLPCNVVLPQGHYQLLLVDAPEVPEDEMRNALRWKIKDLVTLSLDDAAIEYFRLPEDGAHSRKKMVYVVITEMERLRSIVTLLNNVDLKLESIDINELVMRNLATSLIDSQFDGRGVAIARLRQGRGSVSLFKKGNLYLSRQFDLDYQAGLLEELPEDILVLELQRSLDYYERQMGQAAPGVVYICGDGVAEDKITDTLRASLASSIQYMDVSGAIGMAEEIDTSVLQQCLGAIGGSLRTEANHATN
ncbi:MAG TPA: MSHA biogenesis protein MshI [Marinagarivorans sp.]